MVPPRSKTPSLHARLVEELTSRIVSGALPCGALLPPEPRLAEEFGVSRIVVRESVKVLVEKGLVEVRQGRGTTVRPESEWNPLDPLILRFRQHGGGVSRLRAELLEARQVFEVQMVGMAATRVSEEELQQLSGHLRRMDTLMRDPDAFHAADTEFHLMIMRAAQNRVLAKLIEPIRDLLRDALHQTVTLPGAPQSAQVFHWRIYRALEARDPFAAQEAMRAHLDRAAEDLLATQANRNRTEAGGVLSTGRAP
ncbi:DNA-binding FadR family transcriptional regulator [Deinobacterium chartae]|uniref:DNA-binding FadR family transcriptional regulator n=1 Tax=Deinobacterium chartae TaxID=521158 RepID=A0A841HYB0_9DEIO|nr:FadR/GntR family transcriptional regulator [Deinobacterium chartae]MBB6096775.1 DNA-binding FadR family transcriptional regulator [Deinobacterium chartae]